MSKCILNRGRKITYVTLFPLSENLHLSKDAGMIPYVLHRNYKYDSYLLTYNNGEYPDLKTEVPGLKLLFIKPTNRLMKRCLSRFKYLYTVLDVYPILLKFGKRIDVLELYFYCIESILIATIYKLVNKKGCVFLKLDYGFPENDKLYEQPPKAFTMIIKNYILRKLLRSIFDIIALESWLLYDHIKNNHPRLKWIVDRIYHIPNGVDANKQSSLSNIFNKNKEKENIILHIGRVGSYQKASDIVLKVFSKVAIHFPNWRLILIGNMEKDFINYYDEYLKTNDHIRDRITYVGFMKSRKEVFEYYNRSKILLFPSRYEAFPIVPIEAGFFKSVILGSDIPSVMELTDDGKLGYLCPVDDVECFTHKLEYVLSHVDEVNVKSGAYRKFIIEKYNWDKICSYLNEIIVSKLDEKWGY